MRKETPLILELARILDGDYASTTHDGMAGAFLIRGHNTMLRIISSGVDEEYKWEHVSVSTKRRTPLWEEMCLVKDLFWTEDECVIQYHPPKSEYVNYHPHCLHLWKPIDITLPMPPSILVGPKDKQWVTR